jgi:hypothetical protein
MVTIISSILAGVATDRGLYFLDKARPGLGRIFQPVKNQTKISLLAGGILIALFLRFGARQESLRQLYEASFFPPTVKSRWVDMPDTLHPSSSSRLPLWRTRRKIVGTGHRDILNVLEFAKTHSDGRYAVQRAPFGDEAAPDSQALSAFLGMQGNESLYSTFREASPIALFTFPQIDAISVNTEMFGISSMLAEDLDFWSQPLETHLSRLQALGTKYFVVYDDRIKNELDREPAVLTRTNFGHWSVFALRNPASPAEVLRWRPALIFSDLSLKLRRTNEHGFTRLAEEQFEDNWFDVLLAYSEETRIDRVLDSPAAFDRFGALVIERYDYENLDSALTVLKEFSRHRPILLFPKDDLLFDKIRANLRFFPKAIILNTTDTQQSGEWMQSQYGAHREFGGSAIHKEWKQIRDVLDANKTPVADSIADSVMVRIDKKDFDKYTIAQEGPASNHEVPILIRTTYHPRWRSTDGSPLFIASPFFTLVFSRGNTNLVYERNDLDRAGILLSSATILLLIYLAYRGERKYLKTHYKTAAQREPGVAVIAVHREQITDER